MKPIRLIVSVVTAFMLTGPVCTRADVVEDAYQDYMAGRYDPAFNKLFAYRITNEGTLRVDFMLAVIACRLSDDHRALGGYLLKVIPDWYEPLPSGHLDIIRREARQCPSTGITEKQAVSKLSGKEEGPDTTLAPKRSNTGRDQPLPPVPAHIPAPSGTMSSLIKGHAYLQGDYRSASADSAADCSALCSRETRCLAMTFVISQKRCWLKDTVPAMAVSKDMISAYKWHR